MAVGRSTMVTSNHPRHWSLHTNTHTHILTQTEGEQETQKEGKADNICRKWTRDVRRLSTPSAPSSPAAGTYLMSCFTRWRATGLAFRFSNKLKFRLCTGNHYSIAYRFVLNASLASFVSFPVRPLRTCSVVYEHIS